MENWNIYNVVWLLDDILLCKTCIADEKLPFTNRVDIDKPINKLLIELYVSYCKRYLFKILDVIPLTKLWNYVQRAFMSR